MSSCALAATPVFNRNGVPNIITYANANTLTEQGFDNIASLTYTTKSVAIHMAEKVKNRFKKKTVSHHQRKPGLRPAASENVQGKSNGNRH